MRAAPPPQWGLLYTRAVIWIGRSVVTGNRETKESDGLEIGCFCLFLYKSKELLDGLLLMAARLP